MSHDSTRIALITGASRGLGKSMALHVADRGVDVVVTYHSKEVEANEVVAAIRAKGRRGVALRLDVGDVGSFGAFAEQLKAALEATWKRDRFDFLVNNAGVGLHKSFEETTEADFDRMMNIHFKGTFFLTQRLLPLVADGGRILNVSSGLARFAFPGYAAYASMKGGVEVNVVAPGAIETDFGGGAVRDDPALNAQIASVTALGRAGLPEDVGGVVAMLLAPEARWVNGQRVEVSGGMML
jgi:NAD(P)-dependent dehydrogenase (short-subunit alcohol dehydrogenase family)